MKINPIGLLRLKPFDEAFDAARAGRKYADSAPLTVLVFAAAGLGILSILFAVIGSISAALTLLALSVAVSAVTSGLEWNAGLKARAANQMFVTVVCAGVLALLVQV